MRYPAPDHPSGLIRLFVALELPGRVRAALEQWRRPVLERERGLRAVDTQTLHVTLCFLGSRPAEEVQRISAACRVANGRPAGSLSLGAALWLPPRRPRVLTVALDDLRGELAAIQAAVSGALVDAQVFQPERQPFLAHVTVARVRPGQRVAMRTLVDPPSLSFAGEAVVLLRSVLGHGPARYQALERVTLAQAG